MMLTESMQRHEEKHEDLDLETSNFRIFNKHDITKQVVVKMFIFTVVSTKIQTKKLMRRGLNYLKESVKDRVSSIFLKTRI